jgi:hypothetical protein
MYESNHGSSGGSTPNAADAGRDKVLVSGIPAGRSGEEEAKPGRGSLENHLSHLLRRSSGGRSLLSLQQQGEDEETQVEILAQALAAQRGVAAVDVVAASTLKRIWSTVSLGAEEAGAGNSDFHLGGGDPPKSRRKWSNRRRI